MQYIYYKIEAINSQVILVKQLYFILIIFCIMFDTSTCIKVF